jgi:hypothetical protein
MSRDIPLMFSQNPKPIGTVAARAASQVAAISTELARWLPRRVRRWLAYRRLLAELAAMQGSQLRELRICRCAVRDFAWHCADHEVGDDADRHATDTCDAP